MLHFVNLSLLFLATALSSNVLAIRANPSAEAPRLASQAHVHSPQPKYYHDIIARRRGLSAANDNITSSASHLEKRAEAKLTLFDGGPAACGGYVTDSEFVVALNQPDWDGGSHCFDMITITYNGKSTQAQIVDMCVVCPHLGLDLTRSLFSYFADAGLGIIYGDWSYGGDAGNQSSSSNSLPSSTSHTSRPTTTLNPSTTSKISTSVIASSIPSFTSPSSRSSNPAIPTVSATVTASSDGPQLLNQINILIIQLGNLVTAGASLPS